MPFSRYGWMGNGVTSHTKEVQVAGRRLAQPLLAIWGDQGTVGQMFDVMGYGAGGG